MNRKTFAAQFLASLTTLFVLSSGSSAQYVRQPRNIRSPVQSAGHSDFRSHRVDRKFPTSLPPYAYGFTYHRQETDYSCGVAAFMPIGRYWGVYNGPEKELYRLFEVDPETGTPELALEKGAKYFGLEAFIRQNVSIATLRLALAEGYTPILEIQAWPINPTPGFDWENDWDDGHYVALMAIDDHYAYFMDSAVEEHGQYAAMSLRDLDKRWHNWADLGPPTGEFKAQHLAVFIRGHKRYPIDLPPSTPVVPLE